MNIENIILEILGQINGFPQKDTNDVLELIEHNEWGVAFEIICSVIEQERLNIKHSVYDKIVEIGTEMELSSCLWTDILEMVDGE
ncbi:MAG: MafI family immunity protein [Halanaerobiales bacterium]|nr:MafI family immunity protein [Halanaerobiales bacterium]